jgi:hypothetical protein
MHRSCFLDLNESARQERQRLDSGRQRSTRQFLIDVVVSTGLMPGSQAAL